MHTEDPGAMFHRHPMPLIMLLKVAACDLPDPTNEDGEFPGWADPQSLVNNAAWAREGDRDPFPAHRPHEVACTRAAVSVDNTALELDTAFCNYFVLSTSTVTEVVAGDRITVGLFHDELAAPEPAVAHMALSVAGAVIWDQEVSIPSEATPYTAETIADFDAPEGSPVVLHLHNHGVNSYRLIYIRIEPRQ